MRGILGLVFPPICLACERISPDGRVEIGLCSTCRLILEPVADAGSLPFPVLSLWWYRAPLIEVIHGLKFRRFDFLGAELGEALASRFGERLKPFDLIVPVPLDWRRRIHRGYNQSEEIARELGSKLGLPVRNLLRRSRRTPPQARLDTMQRRQNLRRAFRPRGGRKLESMNVILVDDVMTTGATLRAAAAALSEGRARSVLAATAARTPPASAKRAGKRTDGFLTG